MLLNSNCQAQSVLSHLDINAFKKEENALFCHYVISMHSICDE